MTRLQSQWRRLYAPQTDATPEAPFKLIDTQGQVRAVVLELCRPAEWGPLAALWQGVQADLGWPAPAIAINGHDGYQLWFSLQLPVGTDQASAVLQALCTRYLADVAPHRLRLFPHPQTASNGADECAVRLPGLRVQADQWSAFVAHDLAPVFADTPWLDIEAGQEGQAELLSRLRSIPIEAFQATLDACQPNAQPSCPTNETAQQQAAAVTRHTSAGGGDDPRHFLVSVMNDTNVALALRVEAAKALLLDDKPRRHD